MSKNECVGQKSCGIKFYTNKNLKFFLSISHNSGDKNAKIY